MMKHSLRDFSALVLVVLSCACAPASKPSVASSPSTLPPKVQEAKKEAPAPEKKKDRLPPKERGKVSSISITDLFTLQQSGNVLIYDARPSVLFREGHIPGAINMPKSIVDDVITVRAPELKAAKAANKQIVVYCSGVLCADSRTVAHHLASAGYSSSIFNGGWDEWKTAGLPSE